ncbi:MAG TPA: YfhO family protein [Flavipsychrobacter sp.]|nr:YfhO family protein [Flavipsychrobacter sp.]
MRSIDFKKLTPHLLIIVGFAVFSLFYSFPVLQGKVLAQHDLMNWRAMFQQTQAYYDSTGINPLWSNSMFGGMPSYTIGYPKSGNFFGNLGFHMVNILSKPAAYFFVAMTCFYILMVTMRINRWLGVIGSFAFAFATNNVVITVVGHETKMLALGFMPAVLAGLILLYRKRWFAGSALFALSLAAMLGTNHFQVIYYSIFIFAGYAISKFVEVLRNKGDIKGFFISSVIAAVIAVVGIATCMESFLPTKEYAKATMRGGESELTINKDAGAKKKGGLDKDYAFMWSNGIGESFVSMIPYLYGGSLGEPVEKAPETEALTGGQLQSAPLYWGPQKMGISGPMYFGAIICFLFVLGILVVKSPHKWWIVAVCALTVMMSWGDNFKALNYLLFDNLPMYNKFRTPSMITLVPQMLFPLLGMWGLMTIISGRISKEELLKNIKISAGITAGLCLLLGLGGSMFFDYSNSYIDAQFPKQLLDPLKQDRQSLAMKSALTSAVYILIAAGLIWGFAKEKLNKNILIGGIGLLIAIDLLSVASNYIGEEDYQDEEEITAAFAPRPVDQEILKDKDPYYRVLDLSRNLYNDAFPAYLFKNIGGYSPVKMEIYQDLIDVHMGGAQSGGKFNTEVLNMLNTKYIIFANGQQVGYQPNLSANGNAWFVNEAKIVNTADDEMKGLSANALSDTVRMVNPFDSRKTAIVRNSFAGELSGYQFGKDSTASVKLTKYGLNDLSFESNNTQNGLAVFSDIWYPYGWEATVDGKPANIIRANYVLRALKVPAGKHQIEFHFRPKSYETGHKLTVYSNIAIGLLLASTLFFLFRGKDKEEENEPGEMTM